MTIDDETPDERDEETEDEVRNRIEQEADRAVEQFDEGLVDLLSWLLDTETRSRIYVNLRKNPGSTSDEVADGTGLYPSTVREALAALHDEDIVTREKRESDGAGNNPYEYSAIAPSELVNTAVEDVQSRLNTVFNLDDYLDRDGGPLPDTGSADSSDPVTISVEDADPDDDPDDDEDEATP
ncbi:winged helix-turn-helix transcriptional regulator [Haloarcula sp. GH36]|uniref:winged helix-turn-helix transcriptional regulator n=1 Tax=Haloarcula montana TaxID=3111776 RepID=UPI002D7A243F|nr:helix-turn-helix domain-containing protein [Haloarcula sp. GH36]